MQDLEKALKIALEAHSGQKEKNGMPYIFHPIRVSQSVYSIPEKIVALLHDTVEDTDITLEQIYTEFGTEIAKAVEAITKDKNIPYEDYIQGIKNNPLARAVKLADLKDNMDLSRLVEVTKDDLERMNKYIKAFKELS